MAANPKIVVRFNRSYGPAVRRSASRASPISNCGRATTKAADSRTCGRISPKRMFIMITSARDELGASIIWTAELLARCPKLLWVSTSGAGYDTVDVDTCTKAGIIVVNQAGMKNANAVAEHTLGMMLPLRNASANATTGCGASAASRAKH